MRPPASFAPSGGCSGRLMLRAKSGARGASESTQEGGTVGLGDRVLAQRAEPGASRKTPGSFPSEEGAIGLGIVSRRSNNSAS